MPTTTRQPLTEGHTRLTLAAWFDMVGKSAQCGSDADFTRLLRVALILTGEDITELTPDEIDVMSLPTLIAECCMHVGR